MRLPIIKKVTDWFKSVYLKKDGEKSSLNIKSIIITIIVFAIIAVAISKLFGKSENSAIVKEVGSSLIKDDRFKPKSEQDRYQNVSYGGIQNQSSQKNKKSRRIKSSRKRDFKKTPLKLSAKQVIERNDSSSFDSSISTGTNFIGKLISSIDTRDQESFIKVLLPYGGKGIEKDTILLGTLSYTGSGKKVFITFSKAITPQGKEFEINAKALNPKDYSNGLTGDYHRGATGRIAATLGLSMVSGMTEVLTEKQALGETGAITAKSNIKNALYHGASKATQMEASRQAQGLTGAKPYVTIESGTDLIVSLNSPLKLNKD